MLMNIQELNNDVCKELLTILSYSNQDIQDKIPQDIYTTLINKSADSNKEVLIDKTKSLNEQDISEQALDLFSILYYNYIANDFEKNNLLNILNNIKE